MNRRLLLVIAVVALAIAAGVSAILLRQAPGGAERGKPSGPVLVWYAADWCPHCERMAPIVREFHEKHPDVRIVTVFTIQGTSRKRIAETAAKWGISWEVVVDEDGSIAAKLGVRGFPTFIAVRPDGSFVRLEGEATLKQLEKLVYGG